MDVSTEFLGVRLLTRFDHSISTNLEPFFFTQNLNGLQALPLTLEIPFLIQHSDGFHPCQSEIELDSSPPTNISGLPSLFTF